MKKYQDSAGYMEVNKCLSSAYIRTSIFELLIAEFSA